MSQSEADLQAENTKLRARVEDAETVLKQQVAVFELQSTFCKQLEQRERKLMARVEELRVEVMSGHRAFEELYGETFRGRDFSVKLSMAKAERDQLQHTCETQRVAIEQLKAKLGEKPRGADGFGSTDQLQQRLAALNPFMEIANGDLPTYIKGLTDIIYNQEQLLAEQAEEISTLKVGLDNRRMFQVNDIEEFSRQIAEQAGEIANLKEETGVWKEMYERQGGHR